MAFEKLILALTKINQEGNALDRLEAMGDSYIKFAFENPEMYNLMFIMEAHKESLECNSDIRDDGMKAFNLLKALVGFCQSEGY
jgi:hypothetical protein